MKKKNTGKELDNLKVLDKLADEMDTQGRYEEVCDISEAMRRYNKCGTSNLADNLEGYKEGHRSYLVTVEYRTRGTFNVIADDKDGFYSEIPEPERARDAIGYMGEDAEEHGRECDIEHYRRIVKVVPVEDD